MTNIRTRAARLGCIYTWRKLGNPDHSHPVSTIVWTWTDWTHVNQERQHILEAKRLWIKVFGRTIMDPLLEQLKNAELQSCHSQLQRLADRWSAPMRRVLGLPRIIRCIVGPQGAGRRASRPVVLFATGDGLIFVVRGQRGPGVYHLRSFYFPQSLVNGIAEWQDFFESIAVADLRVAFSEGSGDRLPSAEHVVRRRHEIDRRIRFVTPAAWGFEDNRPGARGIGYPKPTAASRAEDVPIDEPPAPDWESDEDEP